MSANHVCNRIAVCVITLAGAPPVQQWDVDNQGPPAVGADRQRNMIMAQLVVIGLCGLALLVSYVDDQARPAHRTYCRPGRRTSGSGLGIQS